MKEVYDDITNQIVVIVSEWHYPEWHSPGWKIRLPDGTEAFRFAWDITEDYKNLNID